jgi:threonine dehydrogenase-like Zn-dependent dehydrogenase
LSALVAAKQRGVDAVVIIDKSDDRASFGRSSGGAEFVARAGIPVFIDYRLAIAHNKVIGVDRHIVVTGSDNFATSAEHRNTLRFGLARLLSLNNRLLLGVGRVQAFRGCLIASLPHSESWAVMGIASRRLD